MRHLIAVLLLAVSAMGCSGDGASNYVGVWQTADERPKTYEIRRDGDTYLMSDLRNSGVDKKNGVRPLSRQGDQLVLNTGMGTAALALSEDKDTLYFDKWAFKRVPSKDADKLRNDITSAQQAEQTNRATCDALGKLFEAKGGEVNRSSAPAAAKVASHAELRKYLMQQANEIPDCKRQLMLY